MTTLWRPLATVAALLLLLTYLVLRGTAPDLLHQEEQLGRIDALILDQAALERDALQARAGLLPNYDPLVDTVVRLRRNALGLEAAPLAGPEMLRGILNLQAAVRDQELLIDTIKSSNALVQNSTAYFAYLLRRHAQDHGGLDIDLANLASDMLRFGKGSDRRDAGEIEGELARLETRADGERSPSERAITAHGRNIYDQLLLLDRGFADLMRSGIRPTAVQLRALLAEEDRQLRRNARFYHVLLYLVATCLLFYLLLLFLKLRRSVTTLGQHAASLETRALYQSMLGDLSTSFIGVSTDGIDRQIMAGLARFGRQLGVDRAYLVTVAEGESPGRVLLWTPGEQEDPAPDRRPWIYELLHSPAIGALERRGRIAVPSVHELPEGEARDLLAANGTQAWLGIPLRQQGRRVGLLGLEDASGPRDWPPDILQHLRLAGDILAHALERQRAEVERERLTARLAQAERMQAIGTLAGGIAHNFNNILGAILGHAEMALDRLGPEANGRRHVEQVRKAGARAKLLVDQILTFGRRAERSRTPVRIAALIEETLGLLSAALPAAVAVETRIVDEAATVLGDPVQLQQIVMNLCGNAAQAMDGAGRIELTLSTVDLDEERLLSHGIAPGGRYVHLAVADRGHGIDEAALARIFEPFFTTKPVGSGTGLGLATVHGIVADHGGALHVASVPGEGTVFEVYLPACEPAPPAPASRSHPGHAGAGQTLLIVDDEEGLVLLAEEMLAALGYEPVGVTDPLRALELFEADPARFDLLLTDEVMPRLLGSQLAARVAAIRPDLPILLMTGHGGLVEAGRLRAAGIREVLHKPLLPSELAAAVGRHTLRMSPENFLSCSS